MTTFTTIVVPIDFSRSADAALRLARALADRFDSRVHLLHVVPNPLNQPWAADAPGTDFPALLRTWTDDARRRLVEIAAKAQLDSSRVTIEVLVGLPQIAIAHYAEAQHADVIVMGRHGHASRDLVMLGSVADQVLRRATCPVLTVPLAQAPAAADEWPASYASTPSA
jgi:nucleotide-binding universal stress UspA family protein